MSHQRKLIRDAVVTALRGTTVAGTNVFPTRFLPLRNLNLPAIAVYTLDEDVDPGSINNTQGAARELTRVLRLMVEGAIKATGETDNPDDALDNFAVQIERALNADDSFGGTCGWSIMESTQIFVPEQGDKAIAVLQLVYLVTYFTDAPEAGDVTLNDLNTIDATWGPNDQTIPSADNAEDKLTNLED